MKRIVILRPEPGNAETRSRALALGLEAISVPLFAIEAVEWTVPAGSFDGLLLTSANAARLAGSQLAGLAHLPVYAVGGATAASARDAGLTVAATGSQGVAQLLRTIDPALRLLHLAGADRQAADLPDGSDVTAVTVYRSRACDLAPNLAQLAGTVALVHSPRAGRRLSDLVDRASQARGTIAIAAISPAAAQATGEGWARVDAAAQPHDEALLALAIELCKMAGTP